MNKKIIVIYKDKKISEYKFSLDSEGNMNLDKKFFLKKREFSILAALTERGTCSLIVKNNNENIIFSAIFDSYDKQNFGTVLFFKIGNGEYLQLDIILSEIDY